MKILKLFKKFGHLTDRLFHPGHLNYRKNLATGSLIVLLIIFITYIVAFAPPALWPAGKLIRVSKGLTTVEVAILLTEEKVIKWPWIFTMITRLQGKTEELIAGDYYFSDRQSVFTVIRRLSTGDFDFKPYKVTIPEGLDVRTLARLLDQTLPFFDQLKFIELAESREGYLFPDTYFFTSFDREKDIIEKMEKNFKQVTSNFLAASATLPRSFSEIIIMASLLEKEARTMESKKIIAGILWKRLDAGIRLQVDAVFPYIIGKNTFQLTKADLQTDSPYNTYLYEGLPPGPIANPGLDSITAALYPKESPYWFYLSDRNGEMHYAVTHDDHVRNKNRYLR